MFERQWHHPLSQAGLQERVNQLESYILNKQYDIASRLLFSIDNIPLYYKKRQFRRLQWLIRRNEISSLSKVVKVLFHGFWPDMDPVNCQLLDILQASSPSLRFTVTKRGDEADILFQSCYTDSLPTEFAPQALRLLFLGENIRPSYTAFDYSLSCDMSSYLGRNIYTPLWIFEVDWFNKTTYPDRNPKSLSAISNGFHYNPDTRNGKIVYVGNNSEPHRISTIRCLQEHGFSLDIYGSQTRPVRDKNLLYSQYSLALAFENSYYPGYTTEKLIHAFQSHTPVLYWGCLDASVIKRSDFLYEFNPYDNPDDMIRFVGNFLKSNSTRFYPALVEKNEVNYLFKKILSGISRIMSQFT